jgi:hypothetical protein
MEVVLITKGEQTKEDCWTVEVKPWGSVMGFQVRIPLTLVEQTPPFTSLNQSFNFFLSFFLSFCFTLQEKTSVNT